MKTLHFIDSHTGGEPTRLILDGGPDLGGGSLYARRERLRERFDHWRAGVVLEPRGSSIIVGALLCEPEDRSCTAGVIFFNNVGYIGMCGHGAMGLIASLAYLRGLTPGRYGIETPVGKVETTLNEDRSVSVRNVPAYRYRHAVSVEVPGYGVFVGDIAWGGNWFFIISDDRCVLDASNIEALTTFTRAVRQALMAQQITGAEGAFIDHIELCGPSPRAGIHSRNFVLCPGDAYDRSPCGTGTSAKLACLAAEGALEAGQIWRQESIIGSVFEGYYGVLNKQKGEIIPTITGRAHIISQGHLCFEEDDPFAAGAPCG